MALFFDLEKGFCGCSMRSTAYVALFHYMVHGIFVVTFVFTNNCYPPFYYTDFIFGGAGAALFVFSLLTSFVANLDSVQWLRSIFAFVLILVVGLTVISTYMYTFERWNDVISTALTRSLRRPVERDFPDHFWSTLVILSCIFSSVFLFYLIYVVGFLCSKTRSSLSGDMYETGMISSTASRGLTLPADTYSTRNYKPYPVQPSEQSK